MAISRVLNLYGRNFGIFMSSSPFSDIHAVMIKSEGRRIRFLMDTIFITYGLILQISCPSRFFKSDGPLLGRFFKSSNYLS